MRSVGMIVLRCSHTYPSSPPPQQPGLRLGRSISRRAAGATRGPESRSVPGPTALLGTSDGGRGVPGPPLTGAIAPALRRSLSVP